MDEKIEHLLFDIAEQQDGFFTAKQAKDAGYLPTHFDYWIKKKKWHKEPNGIYRLVDYPEVENPQLMLWYLWAKDKGEEGVYSHETALALHHLTPHLPERLQMTVPRNYHKENPDPEILKFYYENLLRTDTCFVEKIKVVTPVRAIFDCIIEGALPEDLIIDAIYYALQKKLIESEEHLFLYPKVIEDPILETKVRKLLRKAS